MNKKFLFGMFLIVAGTSAISSIAALYMKDRFAKQKEDETPTVTMTRKEVVAHLYAIKSVVEKADEGGYDGVQDHQAAMESDFKFFKIEFMES